MIRIEPQAEDLKAFGYNMMDPGRRKQVLATAIASTPATVRAAL